MIGRTHGCDIVVRNWILSRQHFEWEATDGGVFVRHSNNTAGFRLNGRRSEGDAGPLAIDDVISVGEIRFRLGVAFPIDPLRLARDHGLVARLACSIRDEKRWDSLPILADALEDAG